MSSNSFLVLEGVSVLTAPSLSSDGRLHLSHPTAIVVGSAFVFTHPLISRSRLEDASHGNETHGFGPLSPHPLLSELLCDVGVLLDVVRLSQDLL